MNMKTKVYKKIYVLAFLFVFSLGCSDFLDTEIPGKLAISDFYKTDEDALQAVTAVYDMMQADHIWGFADLYMIKNMLSEEVNTGGGGEGDQPALQQLNKYSFDAENVAVLAVWRQLYYAINRANEAINRINTETELRKRLVAEAKTLRAFNFLELVSLWGGVPIILDEIPAGGFTSQTRATPEEVYAQIEKDLLEAIPELPEKSAYNSGDRFRVAKGTARAILGKAYLYQEKWQDASEQLNAIIISTEYQLESNFAVIFSKEGEFGSGSLFELNYSTLPNSLSGRIRWNNRYIQLMGMRSPYFVPMPGDSLVGGGWGFNFPKAYMHDIFVSAGDSARKVNTVMSVAELRSKGGNWTDTTIYGFDGVVRRKYGNYTTERSESDPQSFGTNWRLIRYADVLLMASEAYYHLNNEAKSLTELNKVRIRAHLNSVVASGNELFEAIVKERQLEFAFEFSRFNDLVRWGRAAEVLAPYGFQSGKNELLPIPNDDVRSGGITQNPGYN